MKFESRFPVPPSFFGRVFLFLAFLSSCNPPPEKHSGWVSPPDAENTGAGLYIFTNSLNLDSIPPRLVLDISADTRYQLYVNGYLAGLGPQISSPGHWKYDSYNLSGLLRAGENKIAVGVYSFGDHAGRAMITSGPALWSRLDHPGKPDFERNWKVSRAEGTFFNRMKQGKDIRGGFLTPSMDSLVDDERPHYWNYPEGNPGRQVPAIPLKDSSHYGPLKERNIRYLEMQMERFRNVVRQSGPVENLLVTADAFTFRVPAQSTVKMLIDNQVLTTSYPFLLYSGGKGGNIRITYAEALYSPGEDGEADPENLLKGNRNRIENKEMTGHYDRIFPDGGKDRIFFPSWFRVFRYVELEVTTAEEPLVIRDFHSNFTAYPFTELSFFESPDPLLDKIRETAWRTMRLCSWETYMDCPYYEQLQYVGDTRIQALVSLYGSGDPLLMRNAIEQFAISMGEDSLTRAAFPSQGNARIPPFSLFWSLMIRDYYFHVGEPDFVFDLLPRVKKILEWHAGFLNESNVLEDVRFWNFVDWPHEWAWDPDRGTGGMPAGAEGGVSSIINLQYSYAMRELAFLFKESGDTRYAEELMTRSERINQGIRNSCWSETRDLLADSPARQEYSQHANIMAVLSGMIPEEESGDLIERVAFDTDLIQTTVYYRFYLNRALEKAGRSGLYLSLLEPWKTMLDLGLSTFAERPEPTRSDCHGWSASPHYEFLALVAGIRPLAPGFTEVLIAPSPGKLTQFRAGIPHPRGRVELNFDGEGRVARVSLPEGTRGTFRYAGINEKIGPGESVFRW